MGIWVCGCMGIWVCGCMGLIGVSNIEGVGLIAFLAYSIEKEGLIVFNSVYRTYYQCDSMFVLVYMYYIYVLVYMYYIYVLVYMYYIYV
jgi:hypothetical protein